MLTVLYLDDSRDSSGETRWMCECDCGTRKVISRKGLLSGRTKSCGCLHREMAKVLGQTSGRRNLQDLTGMRFGRLTVISRAENDKNGSPRWNCLCDCGNSIISYGSSLRYGDAKSCGCLARELTKERNTTHGLSKSKLHRVWANMKDRCENEFSKPFPHYGGRGIKVCEKWHDFMSFYEWAMSNGYTDGLSIDRINVDGDYEPSNCRWATQKEQNNNKTDNVFLSLGDKTHTISEWSEILGIKASTLRSRRRKGLSDEEVLSV